MRPHLVSKVLSLYDRVAHHRSKRAPESADVDVDVDVAADSAQLDDDEDTTPTARMAAVPDQGELYGVHTPAAADRHIPDNDASFEVGQNWIEALEERAAEGGPEPEQEVDVEDEADDVHPHTDTRDRPIADLGSGGRGGL
jgi:hypothetical protein